MSGGNSGVESLPSKQMVAGSNPVPRSMEMLGIDYRFEMHVTGSSAAEAANFQ